MQLFYAMTHSWAVSIVLLTIALRAMMYPLNNWSIQSTVKMQEIATGKNEPVRAISAGKVAYSGELPDYGRVTIIDHGSRRQFEIAKALRLGQAVVDTASAAVTGYNNGMTAGGPYYGPILGAAYAAAAIAFGGAQIATIASAHYGGGGGVNSATASTPSASTGTPPSSEKGATGQAQRGQAIVWNIIGDTIGADSVREMAKKLDQFVRDGGSIGSLRTT